MILAGALDDGGGAAGNLVVALDVVVAGGESGEGGADYRDVQVDVRPVELLVLLHGVWRSCTSRSALQAR